MQHYELLYLLPASYSDEEQNKLQEKIKDLIFKGEGKITKEGTLGILRLAYPIKQVHQGKYLSLEFDLEPENLKKIENELKLMPEILRYLVVKKIPESEKQLEQALLKEQREELEERRAEREETEKKEAEKKIERRGDGMKKVSIEELDEKLDKILDSDII